MRYEYPMSKHMSTQVPNSVHFIDRDRLWVGVHDEVGKLLNKIHIVHILFKRLLKMLLRDLYPVASETSRCAMRSFSAEEVDTLAVIRLNIAKRSVVREGDKCVLPAGAAEASNKLIRFGRFAALYAPVPRYCRRRELPVGNGVGTDTVHLAMGAMAIDRITIAARALLKNAPRIMTIM